MSKKNFPAYEPLDDQLRMLGSDIHPTNELKAAVVTSPATVIIPARVHIKQTAKAVLLYAVCIALFLGAIMLLPRLFSEQAPVGTQPGETTAPVTTDAPPLIDRDTITNPDALTPIQLEMTQATWEAYKDRWNSAITIDSVANYYTRTFIAPCGDGYALFMCDFLPTGQALTRVLIGDCEFRYYNTDTLDYYEDGKFYELGDAYAAKLFTDDDLRGVWEAYKVRCANSYTPEADAEWEYLGYGSIVSSDPDSLSLPERYSEKELKAIYALWAVFKDKKDQITKYNVRTINDIRASEVTIHGDVVVCYDLYSKYPQGSFTETVLGYEFYYITSIRKRAFVNGAMYTLQEAYDKGLLTEEDIRIAWLSHADNGERFCEHDYVITEGTPSCTEKNTLYYTCAICGHSYSKSDAIVHQFSNGICTVCGFKNLPLCSGDEIMELIKESGCPEEYLVYGFDSEVSTDELTRIRDFLINSPAKYAFHKYYELSTFYSATEINPNQIASHFPPTNGISVYEQEALDRKYGVTAEDLQNGYSVYKMTIQEFHDYWQTYFGIEFTEEMEKRIKRAINYWEEFNAYYSASKKFTGCLPLSVPKAYKTADGTVLAIVSELAPEKITDNTFLYWVVLLTPNGDSYHISMSVNLDSSN